jgi:class 3 adenylate cyclase/tetratricopeptide (TPR) repeat protein
LSTILCPGCGEENPGKFRLCGFCGTSLVAAPAPQELRRTVTIVFSDLKGSTSLGERLDQEALREVMGRYFECMSAVLERHGGRIEKFIGDAIMAVFGLPHSNEDDALRAVRAAIEMKTALAAVNGELYEQWGVTLENRTGVNTGEVIAADSADAQRLVTGDAVNVAARLEQAAPSLEILIGESTYRLVRHAVEVETVEPLELKGKSQRIPAYKLLSASREADSVVRNRQATLVGREHELAALQEAFSVACAHGRAQSVTIVGDAGLGKSRLVHEFTTSVRVDATIAYGRALAYGEGITFWPLVGVIRDVAEIAEDDAVGVALGRLSDLADGREDVAERVASAVGLSQKTFPLQDIFWAIRELVTLLAQSRPLVIVFEDVHWAEPAFLDLIEHLVDNVDAPVLIICDARPEFLELRPRWRDRVDSAVIALEPLSSAQSERVIANMLGVPDLDERVRDDVIRAAEGNPLFVEQLVSMLVDDGLIENRDGSWHARPELADLKIPPTIQMLLAARLDGLGLDERAIVDPASVIGHFFPREAVLELCDPATRARLDEHLDALVRKRLVEAAVEENSQDETFRFQHVLIRNTAYDALLKRTRATLHERFADWAERVNRERGRELEFEEILGYHLEQAWRYLVELGPLDDRGRALGVRASQKLEHAGRRAFQRGDMQAAANLLHRAVALLPADDQSRLRLLPALGEALMEGGEFTQAETLLDEVVEHTPPSDVRLNADAVLTRWLVRHHVADDLARWRGDVLAEVERLIPQLERIDAHAELAKAWRMLGFVHGGVCRWGEQVEAVQKGLAHARTSGDRRLEARLAGAYTIGLRDGPTNAVEAIEHARALIERGLPDRQAEAIARCSLAVLLAMQADFDAARAEYRDATRILEKLGGGVLTAFATIAAARVETLAGRPEDAVGDLGMAFEALGGLGER